MDEVDRKTITHNLQQLVLETDIDILLPKLLEKGVFSQVMIEKYYIDRSPSFIRKEELYLDIQTRGPEAFRKLVESLMETGHFDLARILVPNVDIQGYLQSQTSTSEDVLPRTAPRSLLQYLHGENQFEDSMDVSSSNTATNEPLKVVVKQATHRHDRCLKKDLPVYPVGSRPKGYFFMINNVQFINNIEEERKGAEVDEKNLKILFQGLGYEVICERDQGLHDMRRKIQEFSQKEEHSHVDSCVVALLSHGRANTYCGNTSIIASDGGELPIEWIVSCFSNVNCPQLQGKPKIFIVQTCRGNMVDYGVKLIAGRTLEDGIPTTMLRTCTDILIAYSTLPGYKSYRDKYLGTWFIQIICKVFMEHAHDTDILDMLTMVDSKLSCLMSESKAMQTSCFENRAFRKFYFNPGIYDDDTNIS